MVNPNELCKIGFDRHRFGPLGGLNNFEKGPDTLVVTLAGQTAVEAAGKMVEGTAIVVVGSTVKAVGNSAEENSAAVRSTAAAVVNKKAEETVIVVGIEVLGTEVGEITVEALVMGKLGLQFVASPSKVRNKQFQFVFHLDVKQNR